MVNQMKWNKWSPEQRQHRLLDLDVKPKRLTYTYAYHHWNTLPIWIQKLLKKRRR